MLPVSPRAAADLAISFRQRLFAHPSDGGRWLLRRKRSQCRARTGELGQIAAALAAGRRRFSRSWPSAKVEGHQAGEVVHGEGAEAASLAQFRKVRFERRSTAASMASVPGISPLRRLGRCAIYQHVVDGRDQPLQRRTQSGDYRRREAVLIPTVTSMISVCQRRRSVRTSASGSG